MKPLLMLALDAEALRYCEQERIPVVAVFGASVKDFGDPLPPAGALFVEDVADFQQVFTALTRAGYAAGDFAGLYTGDERSIVTAGALRGLLGLCGPPPEVGVLFRDKWLQKEAIRAAGLPAAASRLVEDIHETPLSMAPGTHAVIKPAAGAGTKLTAAVRSDDELRAFAASVPAPWRTFVLEEFVPGAEFLVDGVVVDDELAFFSVTAYAEPCLSAVVREAPLRFFNRHPDDRVYEAVRPVVTQALKALRLSDGVFHLELFENDGRFVFGECAARRGGALVQQLVSTRFGVDLARAAVNLAMGRRPVLKTAVRDGAVGSVYLPNRPGTLLDFPSRAELLALPGVEYARIELPRGFRMRPGTPDTISRIGQVLVTAADDEQLEARLEHVGRWFGERLTVVPDGTTRELRSWSAGWKGA
jgi:biotin carboxylase